jgi:hypothetical protein
MNPKAYSLEFVEKKLSIIILKVHLRYIIQCLKYLLTCLIIIKKEQEVLLKTTEKTLMGQCIKVLFLIIAMIFH